MLALAVVRLAPERGAARVLHPGLPAHATAPYYNRYRAGRLLAARSDFSADLAAVAGASQRKVYQARRWQTAEDS